MDPVRSIACLSLQSTPLAGEGYAELPGGPIRWQVIPCPANLDQVREELPKLLKTFDAVSLEGITSTFRIAHERYRHEALWRDLDLQKNYHRVSDGSGLKAVLERHLVKQASDELGRELKGKRVLFLCGLSRYGSAEVLSTYAKEMIFGDLLYGYRLGIPIIGFNGLVSAAPALIRSISASPAQWFWPSTRPGHTLGPKHVWLFKRADVVVGDIVYFTRYAPPLLKGKTIFTSIYSEDDLAVFRSRQASKVVSLTPMVNGQYIPASVLGAAFKLACNGMTPEQIEDYYIDCIQKMQLEPVIYDLAGEGKPELAATSSPVATPTPIAPASEEEVALGAEEAGKFCFVIHPLSFKYVKRIPIVKFLSTFIPTRWLEDMAAHMKVFPVAAIRNIVSKTGARAEGILFAVPMTSKAILRYPPEFLYQRLLRIADMAQEKGCRVMGLGAFTSVVGDAGLTVSRRSPIGVTSGNSFTVAATLKTLKTTAERCGIDLKRSSALVVGATGSIGSICARLLADDVQELYLVSPRPERLLGLARQIEAESPQIAGRVKLSRHVGHFLPLADVIITTTSTVEPVIDVTDLKPGCVVCDVARPPDIKEEAAAKRKDILVIESGEIRLPEGADMKYDIGLPPGTIYACLAETILLALERKFGHYTIGREINPAQVREIAAIGEKHGFDLAEIRSFGQVVSDEHVARLREINAARFAPRQAASA